MTCYQPHVYNKWRRLKINLIAAQIARDWGQRLFCDGRDFMWEIAVLCKTNPKKANSTEITWEDFKAQKLPEE